MNILKLDDVGRAWSEWRLNDHLRDFDVSEARDRAIEARTAELLQLRGPKGYHPLDENVRLALEENFTSGELLQAVVPHLEDGNYHAAGKEIESWLILIAEGEARAEAAIQIDNEWNEASGAELDAYDDRMNDR
jgi:hypothetical protein